MGARYGSGSSRPARLLPRPRDVLEPVAAAGCAFLVMGGVAALGLHLAGAGAYAPLHRLAAAVVALAVGGSVDLSGDLAAGGGLRGGISMGLRGGVDVVPLGVTLAGAVTLAAVFLFPLRRRPPVGTAALAVRAGAAAAATTVCLLVLLLVGQGTVQLDELPGGGLAGRPGAREPADRPGILPAPDGGPGSLRDSLFGRDLRRGGGVPGRDGLLGGGTSPGGGIPVGFRTSPGPTVLGGLAWVVVVLGVGWLALRSAPLPGRWAWLGRSVRPVVAATVVTVLGAALVGTAGGLVVAGRQGGQAAAGAALLVAPNAVAAGLPLSVGVPWSGALDLDGLAAGALLPGLDVLPGGGSTVQVSLGDLPAGARWLPPLAATLLVLLPCGVLAATGARRAGWDDRRGRGTVRIAALRAGRLGVGLAVALPLLTTLAGGSAHLGASVLGMELLDAAASLRGDLPLAVGLGGLCGAMAGFLGSLLVDTVSRGRRAVSSDREADLASSTT